MEQITQVITIIGAFLGCMGFLGGIVYVLIKSKIQDEILKDYVTKEKLNDVQKPVIDKLDELAFSIKLFEKKITDHFNGDS